MHTRFQVGLLTTQLVVSPHTPWGGGAKSLSRIFLLAGISMPYCPFLTDTHNTHNT